MPIPSEDHPLSPAELAQAAGIAANTIRSWAKLADGPLRAAETARGRSTYTIAQLRAFCAAHPERAAARRALRNLGGQLLRSVRRQQPEEMHAAMLNLRVAAQAALEAASSAVRQAEQNAAAHREQVDALTLMIRSYDDLLSQLTAPTTLHD